MFERFVVNNINKDIQNYTALTLCVNFVIYVMVLNNVIILIVMRCVYY